MRFLLVLLAMLSGLSLPEVSVAAVPAEVVGLASGLAAQQSQRSEVCAVRARIARCAIRLDRAQPPAPRPQVHFRPCGVTIADQPRE